MPCLLFLICLSYHVACLQQVKEYLHGKLDHLPSVPNETSNKRKHEDAESAEAYPAVVGKAHYRRSDLERSLRSRENLLIVASKDFTNILKIYSSAERTVKDEIDRLGRAQVSQPCLF